MTEEQQENVKALENIAAMLIKANNKTTLVLTGEIRDLSDKIDELHREGSQAFKEFKADHDEEEHEAKQDARTQGARVWDVVKMVTAASILVASNVFTYWLTIGGATP